MKDSKRIIIISALVILTSLLTSPAIIAQKQKPTEEMRKEALTEMRNFKHDFFKKDLGLSRDQEAPFFKVYDQMDDELMKLGEETRLLERKINADADASDLEMESAARTIFEQKKKEGEIELKYFDELKNVLNKRQLLKLKETERRFNRVLLKYSNDKGKGRNK